MAEEQDSGGIVFNRDDILYLAGFLDGEGCFSVSHHEKGNVHCLSVEQTDGRVLEWCAATFGGNCRPKGKRAESREDMFIWAIYRRGQLILLLTALVPHLKVKKIPATILLDYCLRFNRGTANRVPYTAEENVIADQYIALMRIANSTGSGSNRKKAHLRSVLTSIDKVRTVAESQR